MIRKSVIIDGVRRSPDIVGNVLRAKSVPTKREVVEERKVELRWRKIPIYRRYSARGHRGRVFGPSRGRGR